MGTRGRAVGAVVAAALALGSAVAGAGPAAAHGACRSGSERVYGLTASAKVSCATARAVAAAYDARIMAGGSFPGGRTDVNGFRCAANLAGPEWEEAFAVRCTGGRGVVRFEWGV